MPRNGELSIEEKARAVLTRTGRAGNSAVAAMTEDELNSLAAIYDRCCAPEHALSGEIDKFWGDRQERLDAAKATDETQPDPAPDKFRNKSADGEAAT